MRRLFCILAALVAAGSAAAAGVDASRGAALDKAADAFMALAKDAHKTGKPPRQDDPAVKPLLDVLFDTAGLGAVPFSDIDRLDDWMTRLAAIHDVYTFAGTGVADPAKLAKPDAKLQQKIAQNIVLYSPEMGRYADATVQLSGAIMECIVAAMAAHPDEFTSAQAKQGLASERTGTAQMLGSVVALFATPGLDPAWMRERLGPLNAVAPPPTKFLTAADGLPLRDLSQHIAGVVADPAVKTGLNNFVHALGP